MHQGIDVMVRMIGQARARVLSSNIGHGEPEEGSAGGEVSEKQSAGRHFRFLRGGLEAIVLFLGSYHAGDSHLRLLQNC